MYINTIFTVYFTKGRGYDVSELTLRRIFRSKEVCKLQAVPNDVPYIFDIRS